MEPKFKKMVSLDEGGNLSDKSNKLISIIQDYRIFCNTLDDTEGLELLIASICKGSLYSQINA